MESAVEWFAERISHGGLVSKKQFDELLEQAKEMEKQQITNAYWDGGQDIPLTENRCEQYYNETFKSE